MYQICVSAAAKGKSVEEGKEIALMAECVLDVDTDARHQGVESAALGPDCSLALQHGLYEVETPKAASPNRL